MQRTINMLYKIIDRLEKENKELKDLLYGLGIDWKKGIKKASKELKRRM